MQTIIYNELTTVRTLYKRVPLAGGDGEGYTTALDGEEAVTYQVSLDRDALANMARRAAQLKGQRCADGPLTVKVFKEGATVKPFLVIGYWSDTNQRYAKGVYTKTGEEAEQACLEHSENDSGALRVCAVIDDPEWHIQLADRFATGAAHMHCDSNVEDYHHSIGDRSLLVGALPPWGDRKPMPVTYRDGVVRAKVSDLRPGVRCDLEGDEVADANDEHPEFAFAFETVSEIKPESPDCILVTFASGYVCGFPPDHEIEIDGEQLP